MAKEMLEEDGFTLDSIPDVGDSLDFTPEQDIELAGGEVKTLKEPAEEAEEPEDSQEPEESVNKVMLAWMKEKLGFEYNEEDFEDTPEFVESVLKANYDERANKLSDEKLDSKLDVLPERFKSIVGYHKDGIQVDELIESEERLNSYKGITKEVLEKDTNLQKDVLMTYFTDVLKMDKTKAESKYQKYSDMGEDTVSEEALDAMEALVKDEQEYNKELRQKAEEIKTQKEAKKTENLNEFKAKVMGLKDEELFKGIKLNEIEKQKMFEGLTKPVGTDKLGRPMNILAKLQSEDPNFLMKLYHVAVNLKWDLSQYKATESKVLGNIKSKLDNAPDKTGKATDMDAQLQKMRKIINSNKRNFNF